MLGLALDSEETLSATLVLIRLLKGQSRLDEAEAMVEETLQRATAKHGSHAPIIMKLLLEKARLFENKGNAVGAEQLYREIFEQRRTQLGDNHKDTLTVMAELAR